MFFDQPLEVKKDILNQTNPIRGYTAIGAETTSFLSMGAESRETKDTKVFMSLLRLFET